MLFVKKWMAAALTAAMLAANLTVPAASMIVMAAENLEQDAPFTENSESESDKADSALTPSSDHEAESAQDLTQEESEDVLQESSAEEAETAVQEWNEEAETDAQEGAAESTETAVQDRDSAEDAGQEETAGKAEAAAQDRTAEEAEAAGQEGTAGDADTAVQNGAPGEAEAAWQIGTDGNGELPVITEEPDEEIVIPAEDCGPDTDNDAVFAGYVNRELELEESLQFDTKEVEESTRRMEKAFASTRLTGYNRTIYAILLKEIKRVAAGERSNTVFTVSLEDLGLKDRYWTAAELGVDAIVQDGRITDESMQKLNEKLNISFTQINRSLLADCPYDLYWYDKTIGTPSSGFGYQAGYVGDEYVLSFSSKYDYTFSFPVEAEYSVSGQTDTYEVDSSIGSAVQKAHRTAQSIVDQNSSQTDFEKLKNYKNAICDLVSYNYEAAGKDYSGSYGNPWQLIWVFDEDPDTKVVCEGYSKSFQYLCDLSSWTDLFQECISVSGLMTGGTGSGGHMWNIVMLRDGKNYLVDVTNCDDGTIGDGNDRGDLFLVGTGIDSGSGVYAQGNPDDGYSFPGLNNLTYIYFDDTRNRFGDEVLTLSSGRVNESTAGSGEYSGDHTHIYAPVEEKESTCITAGHSACGQCSVCGEYDAHFLSYPLKDHTPGVWSVSVEPTIEAEGAETTKCTVCGAILTRPLEKLKDFRDAAVTGIISKTFNGSQQTQTPVVTCGSAALKEGEDYAVAYSNNINAGSNTAIMLLTGIGKYRGSVKKTFSINKAVQDFTVKAAASVIDEGKTTTVSASGARETSVYTFTSSNTSIAAVSANGTVTGKAAGNVTITVRTAATADYNAGVKTVQITVKKVLKKPGSCRFVKWNNTKYTGCRVAWNKVTGAQGYETRLTWTDGSHASVTAAASNRLYRDCKVPSNRVTQMKVRAYYFFRGVKQYSPWSDAALIVPSPAKVSCKNVSKGSSRKMKITWNAIYGSQGYSVFVTANPKGKWYRILNAPAKAGKNSAVITRCNGKLKKKTRYYVRVVTRRKRSGAFIAVPVPARNTYAGSFVIK